jgi:predicted RNA binding protein YcfA (HicA-like mRNA interferase family)
MDKVGRVDWKRFEKFLLKIGCEFKGQEGSHRKYKKEGILRPIIVPCVDDLAPFIIANNLRTLGIPKKVYLEMIARL